MTKGEALAEFGMYHVEHIPKGDVIWKREAWSNFVDALERSGRITTHQAYTWSNPF